jgi:hypothetical protein
MELLPLLHGSETWDPLKKEYLRFFGICRGSGYMRGLLADEVRLYIAICPAALGRRRLVFVSPTF